MMTPNAGSSPTIARYHPRPDAPVRLVCFSFAGGTARSFHPISASLPGTIEVAAVEYPGRGARFGEPLPKRVDAFVEDIGPSVLALMDRRTVFFGYSLGCQVAFQLV